MKVLFFKAPWCAPCHAIASHVPSWCEHVDCEEQSEIALKYKVTTVPVFIAVDNDVEIGRIQTTNMASLNNWYAKLQEAV
jgi:thiol-disulfide isomerase/thioredoxin